MRVIQVQETSEQCVLFRRKEAAEKNVKVMNPTGGVEVEGVGWRWRGALTLSGMYSAGRKESRDRCSQEVDVAKTRADVRCPQVSVKLKARRECQNRCG